MHLRCIHPRWELNANTTIYFAPTSYLNEYAEDSHQTLPDWLTQHQFTPQMQEQIWYGKPLNKITLNQLAKQTGISARAWQNLDHR